MSGYAFSLEKGVFVNCEKSKNDCAGFGIETKRKKKAQS
jgi:hypothetical protein